jgi:hypothetical protein
MKTKPDTQTKQSSKLRYSLEAMLRNLEHQYPDIRYHSQETLKQTEINQVFAKRKQNKLTR